VTRHADMFATLSREPRLRIERLLLTAHPRGLVAGEIESIRLPDNSVDVIISNCAINLSADCGCTGDALQLGDRCGCDRARSRWQVHERLRAGAEVTFIVVHPSEGAELRTKQNSVLEVAIEGHLLDRSSCLSGFRGVRLFPMAVER
jgi:hypothetical protein